MPACRECAGGRQVRKKPWRFDAPEDYEFVARPCTLLTAKPVLYAANVTEDDLGGRRCVQPTRRQQFREYAAAERQRGIRRLRAKIEEEISDLDEADKKEFLAELGVETSGLDQPDCRKL